MKKGFTLIELLVVIAIIVILAGVIVMAINPGERLAESRDQERKTQMRKVQKQNENKVQIRKAQNTDCTKPK